MAFDFERYLQSCEPGDACKKTHTSVAPMCGISNVIPGATKTSKFAEDASNPRPKSMNCEYSPSLDRLLGISSRGGTDMLESRFRSGGQDHRGRAKTGLFKQRSLPVSLDGSPTKSETTGCRRRRNSVRFADEVGENLTTFLLIPSRFENSEQQDANAKTTARRDASTLASDTLDISTKRHQKLATTVSTNAKTNGTPETPETPPFQLCFDQPAANFEDFRRRLFFQYVCLENVKVDVKSHADGTTNGFVNHGTVLCTIKVRNLHPMKRVFARCTDNNWNTYADIPAVYASYGTSGFNEYDTFTFALRNPLRYRGKGSEEDEYQRKTASVEFALCYEVLGLTYWDNNDCRNYRIVWM